MRRFLLFIAWLIAGPALLNAQLQNGSPAPDFSVIDINGNAYSLYAMMGANKSACLDFSATWCGPCWSFHNSGILDQVYNNLGSETTVVMLEADFNTNTNCLYGPAGCNGSTQGNWVAGTPYPIVNLSNSNGGGVNNDYNINYYPTLYVISPDKRAWEISNRSYTEYENWITRSFRLTASGSVTHSTCGDNGKVTLNVTGGYSTLSYQWSNGAATKDLNNIPGGNYSVTITDANGYFKSYGPFTVNGPSKRVDVTRSQLTHIKCFDEATGSIQIDVDYGTPPYRYSWSNGNTSNYNDLLKAGTYTVTVTDNANCTRVKSYTLNQPALLRLTTSGNPETCDESNGFVLAKATGGVPAYAFDMGFGSQASPYFQDLKGEQTYDVTVTDANGCRETSSIYISATHKPYAEAGQTKELDCLSDLVTLNGAQSSQGSAFLYSWTTRDGRIVNGQESLLPDVDLPGTYHLMVTDITNNCLAIDSVFVRDAREYPHIEAKGDTTLNCHLTETIALGSSQDLPVRFYWKKASDTAFLFLGKELNIQQEGRYVLHVQDTVNHCVSKDTVVIFVDQIMPQAIAAPENELSCKNQTILLDGTASSQGPEMRYQWTTQNGRIVSGAETLLPVVDKAGEYILTVENTKNYCSNTASVQVLEQTAPVALFEGSVSDLSIQLNDLSTGLPKKWSWSFGDGTASSLQHPAHTYSAKGEYEICLTVENDCDTVSTCEMKLIGISSALSLSGWALQHVSCFGGQNGAIRIDVDGGVPPYQFIWSNQQNTQNITNLEVGDYRVEITDQQGTKRSRNFTISQPQELVMSGVNIVHATSGSNNGSIDLSIEGGVPVYDYLWSNGQGGNPILDLSAGSYLCTVKDANHCERILGPFIVKELTANNEASDAILFELEPNPVLDEARIRLNTSDASNLTLVDLMGRVIWSMNLSQKEKYHTVSTVNLSPGCYHLIWTIPGKQKSIKRFLKG